MAIEGYSSTTYYSLIGPTGWSLIGNDIYKYTLSHNMNLEQPCGITCWSVYPVNIVYPYEVVFVNSNVIDIYMKGNNNQIHVCIGGVPLGGTSIPVVSYYTVIGPTGWTESSAGLYQYTINHNKNNSQPCLFSIWDVGSSSASIIQPYDVEYSSNSVVVYMTSNNHTLRTRMNW